MVNTQVYRRSHLTLYSGIIVPLTASFVCLVGLSSSVYAQSGATDSSEQTRFSTKVFRRALQQRGLTELLEHHLDRYPSRDPIEKLLQVRELRLAQAADEYLTKKRRRKAIVQANQILKKLIKQHPDDQRHFQWRFALAYSLIYDEAEPYFTRILYEQSHPTDAKRLGAITNRAIDELVTLQSQLNVEYEKLDKLSVKEFERLERSGYIDSIDQLEPKAEYLLLWTWFYDALSRPENDRIRLQRLRHLKETVSKNRRLLDTPHRASRVQVQMLLLVGMTHRLLYRHVIARDLLAQAIQIADRISDPDIRQNAAWAKALAQVEQIRNERDVGRFDKAVKFARKLDAQAAAQHPEDFGLRMVAALLQQSIYRAAAKQSDQTGELAQARQYRRRSWEALTQLISRRPQRRDEIYALLYSRLESNVDPARLDPVEQAALIAGLLIETSQKDKDQQLARALRVGNYFLENSAHARSLLPEVLYNMGVAHYRLHQAADAATFFIRLAKQHPAFEHSQQAAVYAVQLAAGLYEDPQWRDQPAVQTLYLDALHLLVTTFADTREGRYWQFQYAQLLESLQHYQSAANEYAQVLSSHANYTEARFFQLRCLVKELDNTSTTTNQADARQQASEFFDAQRTFMAWITSYMTLAKNEAQSLRLRQYLAQSKLLAAEVQMFDPINRPSLALDTLASIENNLDEFPNLSSRVWRLRLTAFEQLGRLDEAAALIPVFMKTDPQGAGPMLQSLYQAISAQVTYLRTTGEDIAAQTKAETALMLAEQIAQSNQRDQTNLSVDNQFAAQMQLGEANLQAQRFDQARQLFQPFAPPKESINTAESIMARAVMGYGQALYGLKLYDDALPYFNRLATALPDDHPLKWPALLRDLECRTALAEPPVDIIKVIRQHQFLHPDADDETLVKRFDVLLRENQRRLDQP